MRLFRRLHAVAPKLPANSIRRTLSLPFPGRLFFCPAIPSVRLRCRIPALETRVALVYKTATSNIATPWNYTIRSATGT